MSTRLYTFATTPGFTPSGNQGTWSVQAAATIAKLSRTKLLLASGNHSVSKNAAANQSGLLWRYVSDALGAQTITGTLNLGMLPQEGTSSNDMVYRVHVYLTQGDTDSVRGTLLSNYTDTGNEWATASTCKSLSSDQTLSSVTAQLGDRIVVEVGWWSPTSVNSQSGNLWSGSNGADAVPGDTSISLGYWVQFSQTLLWGQTKDVTGTGIVRAQTTKEVTGDGVVFVADNILTTTATGLVQDTKTRETTASGILQQTLTPEVTADADLFATQTAEVLADATTVVFDDTREVTTDARVSIFSQGDLDVLGDAIVVATVTQECSADAVLQGPTSRELTTDGWVVILRQREVDGWALVAETTSTQVTGDAFALNSVAQSVEVAADGFAVPGSLQTRTVTADALLISQPQVTGDAIVTTAVGAARFVKWTADPWATTSGWRLAAAEQVDGDQFVGAQFAVGFQYVAGFSSNVVALVVAVDMATGISAFASLTVEFRDSAGVILTSELIGNDVWAAYRGTVHQSGWLMVELTTPVATTSGQAYSVTVTQTGVGPNLLATSNIAGRDGVIGRVLNCVVVTATAPTALDSRPALVAPRILSGVLTPVDVTISSSISALDALYIAPGATVRASASANITIGISKLLSVQPGGSLVLSPVSGRTHLITTASTTSIQIAGSLTMIGAAKTRSALLASTTAITDTSITLDQTVSGWLTGDRIYLGSSSTAEGLILTLTGISGTTASFGTSLGRIIQSGALVINLSRAAAIRNPTAGQRSGFGIVGEAIVSLTNAELAGIGRTGCLAPEIGTTVTVDDLVLSDLRALNAGGGAIAVQQGGTLTINDLAIVRAEQGVVTTSDLILGGTTLIAGIHTVDRALLVNAGTVTADLVVSNSVGSAVTLTTSAGYLGSISNLFAHTEGALVASAGLALRAIMTAGSLQTVSGESSALLRLGAGAGIGEVQGDGLSSDAPWIQADLGAVYCGKMILRESTTTASTLVTIAGTTFIDLRDEDGEIPATGLATGNLTPGSRVANRNRSVTWYGEHYAASGVMGITPNTEELVELGRIGVSAAEVLSLSVDVSGPGELRLESAIAPDVTIPFSGGWQTLIITTTATADGVVVLNLLATGAAQVGQVTRL